MKMEKMILRGCKAITLIVALFGCGGMYAQQNPPASVDGTVPRAVFDVASIKVSDPTSDGGLYRASPPGDLNVTGITVKSLIMQSYGVLPFQVVGGPEWIDSERYDIAAKVLDDSADENVNRLAKTPRVSSRDAARLLVGKQRVRWLLEDRFKLQVHTSTKEMPIYALVVEKGQLKLRSHEATPYRIERGLVKGEGVPISVLIDQLSYELDHITVDKTGLTGYYNIDLRWTPDDAAPGESSGPSLRTALQEQLGLKIESQRGPVKVLVVDHAERPTPN